MFMGFRALQGNPRLFKPPRLQAQEVWQESLCWLAVKGSHIFQFKASSTPPGACVGNLPSSQGHVGTTSPVNPTWQSLFLSSPNAPKAVPASAHTEVEALALAEAAEDCQKVQCMHVCMCGCMYVCVCMYVRMYACMHVCMYVCMYVCM